MSNPELPERSMHDKIFDMAHQPVPLLDVELEIFLGWSDYDQLQLGKSVSELLVETAKYRSHALSYGSFNAAVGVWSVDGGRSGRLLGCDSKVDDTDTASIHAEERVIAKAEEAGFQNIAVLAVVSSTQEAPISDRETPTLHPCGRCLARLSESELITPDTLIVTARPDFTVVQIANLDAITNHHETGESNGIATFTYKRTPAVLLPAHEPTGVYAFQHKVNTEDYDATIGRFLLHRFYERNDLA